MKRQYLLFLFTLLAFFTAEASINKNAVRVIVCFNNPVHTEWINAESGYVQFGIKEVDVLNKDYQCTFQKSLNRNNNLFVLQFNAKTDVNELLKKYMATGYFRYAESDHIGHSHGVQGSKPNDEKYSLQWGLHNDGTFIVGNPKSGADIHMEDAWQMQTGSNKIIVAILDGGCKLNHPEFKNRWWINPDEISNNGKDDDGDGYVDNIAGWDFVNDDNDPSDDNGHGTNVTSIIAANGDNSIGFAGMDWHCQLIANKILDANGDGYYSDWVDAIYYSIYHNARVLNMSVGGVATSTTLEEAIMYADTQKVMVVSSMGNTNDETLNYPAGYQTVIAVGATNPDDTRCSPFSWGGGSCYGNDINVVAPGNYIYGLAYNSDNDYDVFFGGTSQAAPHVSGLASLILAQNPFLSAVQVKQIIQSTADDQVGTSTEDTKGWDKYYGYGRINASRALTQAAGIEAAENNAMQINIWPNPTSGNIDITYSLPGNQHSIIYINDFQGRTIKSIDLGLQNTGEHSEKLQCNLPQGMYLMSIKGDKFSSTAGKIIIQ